MPAPAGILNHSPADIIQFLLVQLGLGLSAGGTRRWQVYVGEEPDAPDDVITCYDAEGFGQQRSMVTGERFELFGVQIRVRSARQNEGDARARLIALTLDQQVSQTVVAADSDRYLVHSVNRTTRVVRLGRQFPEGERWLFTVNLLAPIVNLTV